MVGWWLTSASVMVVCAEPSFPLCIFIGLAVGTLLYVPIIGLLLWQRRRNRRGKAEPAPRLCLLWELVGISSSPADLDKPRVQRCPSAISYCFCSLGVPCVNLSSWTSCPRVGRRFTPSLPSGHLLVRAQLWQKQVKQVLHVTTFPGSVRLRALLQPLQGLLNPCQPLLPLGHLQSQPATEPHPLLQQKQDQCKCFLHLK